MTFDPEAVRAFERAGWQKAASVSALREIETEVARSAARYRRGNCYGIPIVAILGPGIKPP